VIGVIPKPAQLPVVEEFFELFKTPWELYRPGRDYDVVLAAAGGHVPDLEIGLLIVYGAEPSDADGRIGLAPGDRNQGTAVECEGRCLPVYGRVQTFPAGSAGVAHVTSAAGVAGVLTRRDRATVIRLGYDLFDEVQFLLSNGQPVERAHIPTLDLHIGLLRQWILDAGVPLLEIAPAPGGHDCLICLTHDIDFIGIRGHLFDHTMWGFLYRSTIGAVRNALRRRLSLTRLFAMWRAAASLPFVYLGWAKDFWEPFAWYLDVERGLPATYYLIPFKGRPGEGVTTPGAPRRATAYDITDLAEWNAALMQAGCELGVHGIDAWRDAAKGRQELERIAAVTSQADIGIRMHWLLSDGSTPATLEQAGYAYDATAGYNETVGYRNGTTQVFKPLGARTLLELPLHIQDGALFYPQRLDLPEPEAEIRCDTLLAHARAAGGVLTVLWHDRSHGPERFWGDFYIRLVGKLKATNAWFTTARTAVSWFGQRRQVRFERVQAGRATGICLRYDGAEIEPPLRIIQHSPSGTGAASETLWNGTGIEFFSPDHTLQAIGSLT
jgi:hypothetical protein